MTLAKPAVLTAGALLLIAVPALAQKIAPTRSYQNDNYNAYSDTPRERPDKHYGLPAFGMPGSEVPRQKTLATREPPTSGSSGGAGPGPSQHDPDALLPPAPGTGASSAPAAPGGGGGGSPDLDFFSKQSSNSFVPKPGSHHLPKPARSAASDDDMDTPLFTTPDGSGSSNPSD